MGIQKLKEHEIKDSRTGKPYAVIGPDYQEVVDKVNELVEIVTALIKENNIHEKQIDELQMRLKNEKMV